MNKHRVSLAAAAIAVAFAGSAAASPVPNTNSGSVSVVSSGGQVFPNILLSGSDRANYLIFDLSSVAAALAGTPAGSATLTITDPGFYSSVDATENYALWDFSGDMTALRGYSFSTPPTAAAAATLITDLSSGISFGSAVLSKPVGGHLPTLVMTLNAAAISAINTTLGSASKYFAIGGFSDSLAGNTQVLFQSSNGGPGIASLDVQPVPVPAAIWLLGSGLAGLGAMRRRRKLATA